MLILVWGQGAPNKTVLSGTGFEQRETSLIILRRLIFEKVFLACLLLSLRPLRLKVFDKKLLTAKIAKKSRKAREENQRAQRTSPVCFSELC